MSSACAVLLKILNDQPDEVPSCFCRVYSSLKDACTAPCKRADFNALSSELRSSEGALSRSVVQIISVTSVVNCSDERVKLNMDGCLDRFVSYVFNYAAIHMLSSLSEVRGRVDGFRNAAHHMLFGAEEVPGPGRRRLNSSVYSADYEESVHELTAEDASGDIVEMMERAGTDAAAPGGEAAATTEERDAASGSPAMGFSEMHGASTDLSWDSVSSLADGSAPAPAGVAVPHSVDVAEHPPHHLYTVMSPQSLTAGRKAAFEKDGWGSPAPQPLNQADQRRRPTDDPSVSTLQHSRDDTTEGSSSELGLDGGALARASSLDTAVRRLSLSGGSPVIGGSRRKSSSKPVANQAPHPSPGPTVQSPTGPRRKNPPNQPAEHGSPPQSLVVAQKAAKRVTRRGSYDRLRAEEDAQIARLTRPKIDKKRNSIVGANGAPAECAHVTKSLDNASIDVDDSARSRRHWFGQSLWKSSILVKDEDEAWQSPVKPKSAPEKRRRAKQSPVCPAPANDERNPRVGTFMEASKALIHMLKKTPKGKYFKSYDVCGVHKDYLDCIAMLKDKMAEVFVFFRDSEDLRNSVNGRYEAAIDNPKFETFDESFFGANEKMARDHRHVNMNTSFQESVTSLELAIDEIADFLVKLDMAIKRYERCPNNNSQLQLEKFGVRKGKQLSEVLERVYGLRPSSTKGGARSNPISASLMNGKSWNSLLSGPAKSVDAYSSNSQFGGSGKSFGTPSAYQQYAATQLDNSGK